MKLTGSAFVLAMLLSVPALAEEPRDAAPSPDGTIPLTNRPNGPAGISLPEQDASPAGTSERPGSAASRKAEEIK